MYINTNYGSGAWTYLPSSGNPLFVATHVVADGSMWVALGSGVESVRGIFTSSNGTSWTRRRECEILDGNYVSTSADGQYQYLSPQVAGIIDTLRSDDFGVTWTAIPSILDRAYLSSDGKYVTLLRQDTQIAFSSNFGVTFNDGKAFKKIPEAHMSRGRLAMSRTTGKYQTAILATGELSDVHPYKTNIFINSRFGKGGYS